jgi:hypothetical protein
LHNSGCGALAPHLGGEGAVAAGRDVSNQRNERRGRCRLQCDSDETANNRPTTFQVDGRKHEATFRFSGGVAAYSHVFCWLRWVEKVQSDVFD